MGTTVRISGTESDVHTAGYNSLKNSGTPGCRIFPRSYSRQYRVFAALANETRYEVLKMLNIAEKELCVCELNILVDASEATISQSLSRLVEAGLVSRRKDGRWRKYRATNEATALLATFDGLKTTSQQFVP